MRQVQAYLYASTREVIHLRVADYSLFKDYTEFSK